MFKDKLSLVPHKPGCYQMKNIDGNIIYVGKAKDLNKRLSSYFNRAHDGKTAKLVSEIHDFTYIVASSELEAFIIEINLIKDIDPKYNIMLTDDKTYSYIEYSRNPYPVLRVAKYTKLKKFNDRKIFGPYPNGYAARRIVNLLNRLYPLKKCSGMPKDVCLYYHIHECLGYCVKDVSKESMNSMESDILSFLKGNDSLLKDKIKDKIQYFSDALNFEMALELQNELKNIEIIMDKQKVELHDFVNRDIVGYFYENGYLSITIFFLRNGKLLGEKSTIIPTVNNYLDDLEYYLVKFYEKHEIPKEIFVSHDVNTLVLSSLIASKFITPIKGAKKELLKMAVNNATHSLEREIKIVQNDEARTIVANEELGKILNINNLYRIDVFDNSNLFGNFSVSGMVVFKNGKPAKDEYRKYKIAVDKNDDYHTMQEVIYRRYYRAMVDKTQMPDLIIVDGGENQIRAAKEIIDSLNLNITIVGLKKNSTHSTNELINTDLSVIELDKTSDVFHYLTRIQDEVHRYTINYHRSIRSKGSISSVLDNIPGIGNVRKKELIKKYGSVARMKDLTVLELSSILPVDVANNLHDYLQNMKK